MNTLGQRIAYYRKKLSLTQEELAEKCSVTPQAVSKWENDVSAPDISLLPALAELFGISCDELLGARPVVPKVIPEGLVDTERILFRINIKSADGDVVKLCLPLQLAEAFLASGKFGAGGDVLKNIDFRQLSELAKSGAVGKLIEVNSAGGDFVEIRIE